MIPVHIIVAIDEKSGIGKDGELPWQLTGDLKNFREITCTTSSPKKRNIVLMGRKTWKSIPKQFQPLPDRINVVLSRNPNLDVPEGVLKSQSFDQVIEMLQNDRLKNIIESVFVIGGQQVYEEIIKLDACKKLYITRVKGKYDCDAFFPQYSEQFELIDSSTPHNEGPFTYHFEEYQRKASK